MSSCAGFLAFTLLLPMCGCTFNLFELENELQRYRHVMQNREGLTYTIPIHKMHPTYDFIVVGAGPGGATVANRLTEVPGWSVLVLEAGMDEQALTDIPVFAGYFQHTDYNWGYRSQPEENSCLGLNDRRCVWPRGKGMGGSSILNYMIYTRGHPTDYNNWEEMGNKGWNWDNVLPYFLKSENAKGKFANDSPYHSSGGYLDVDDVPTRTPLAECFMKTAEELHFPRIDYNSGELIGFSYIQGTLRNGARCSANKAFLRPIRNRHNLHISKYSHVTRILIDENTKRAYGVEFYRNGHRYSVKARKEVILSAGAINSPQLLMLSGVGPKQHLEEMGINVIEDLPGVGQNLQDHPVMVGLSFTVNDTVSISEERMLTNVKHFSDYINYGKGILTIAGGVEALGYVKTDISETPAFYPDIELIFIGGHIATDQGRVIRSGLGITDDIYNSVFKEIEDKDAWTIWPMLLKPKSAGQIKLKSKNPFSWPLMYGNYLNHTHDLDTLIEGVKLAVEISKSKAFAKYDTKINKLPIPQCAGYVFATDEYWKCATKYLGTTIHHQCGTTKMGPKSDPMAVVDTELKVYGIIGLRVVDASIIPRIPAAHTYAPTIMIGEKASDMIKQTYRKN